MHHGHICGKGPDPFHRARDMGVPLPDLEKFNARHVEMTFVDPEASRRNLEALLDQKHTINGPCKECSEALVAEGPDQLGARTVPSTLSNDEFCKELSKLWAQAPIDRQSRLARIGMLFFVVSVDAKACDLTTEFLVEGLRSAMYEPG